MITKKEQSIRCLVRARQLLSLDLVSSLMAYGGLEVFTVQCMKVVPYDIELYMKLD